MTRVWGFFAALVGFIVMACASAQSNYPDKPVRMLVGYSPGGPADINARILAQKLSELWAKPVVVENVTGGGGNIATDRVVRSAPDGYTLLMATGAQIIMNPTLYGNLPFDPVRDLAPISQVSVATNILAVSNDVPARSVSELIALAKARPGKLTFASGGNGSTQHLAGELFKTMAGIDIVHVPYKGAAAAVPDLVSGRVTMFFGTVTVLLPLVRDGKLRGLAVTSARRSSAIPDLPTIAELGFQGFEATAWYGLMAPSGAPRPIIERIHSETVKVLAMPDVRAKFADLGMEVTGTSPEEFARIIKEETPRWTKVIRDSGAKAD